MSQTLIQGAYVATIDSNNREISNGWVAIDGKRIVGIGQSTIPDQYAGFNRIDGAGSLLTPGFVNTHHHLYQWATRGIATESTLFEWLVTLYPIWGHLDAEVTFGAAQGALASLLLSGCTYTTDHHYVFPAESGDCLAAEIQAAQGLGIRFHPTRGSMDLGQSKGGLPPDNVVEDRDQILIATEDAIRRFHDPSEDAMIKIAVAPCSPFSVTSELMKEAAQLARRENVRLHTHLAETSDEEDFCQEKFGCSPTDYVESLGWLGSDVWMAHAIHLDDSAILKFGKTGTGAAHCPSSNARLGSGIARVQDLIRAGSPVGLGVDGAASNENGELLTEVRAAVLWARLKDGPAAMSARQSLALATRGGARVLGRDKELGTIEVGKLADLVLWKLDDIGHIDIVDPIAALVLGPKAEVKALLVNGEVRVRDGMITSIPHEKIANQALNASKRLLTSSERVG
ncbi:MAG: 8-oxoguanine deaminase [Actinomycetota bacterium]|nr:8-oxoguanine deaminase [Actinomycetota bacterium]